MIKMTETTLFNELDYKEWYDDAEIIFEELFDNSFEDKEYVITGTLGLWDGPRKNAWHPKICSTLSEAILTCNDGFNGYIRVYEGKYGKLHVHICHHDGNNYMEIRELTKVGKEMANNYKEVGDILKRKYATRNVKYTTNYR